MRITLLGATTVQGPSARVEARGLGGVKPRQLLQMLALDLGTAVPKDRLAERLWDGRPPLSYISTLESYVCLLRRRLSAAGMDRSALVTTGGGYRLDPLQVSVDVVDVHRLLAGRGTDVATRDPAADVGRALALVTGDLLADEPYAAWATEARGRFASLLGDGCVEGARRASRDRRPDLALRLAQAAAQYQPTSEAAARELVRALWRTGRRTEALQAYAELRATLIEELALEPGPTSRRLYTAVLRSDSLAAAPGADHRELATLLRLLNQVLETTGLSRDPIAGRLLAASREMCGLAL